MANPQLEDGYTRISNPILEALSRSGLSGSERSILDVVFRYTYGFNKKHARLSADFISKKCEISHSAAIKNINRLLIKKVLIEVSPPDYSSPREIMFNKNYEEWGSKKDTGAKIEPVSKNEPLQYPKRNPYSTLNGTPTYNKEKYKEKYKEILSSSSSLYVRARAHEELTSDDILAFEELSLLPQSAQSKLEDCVVGLVKKYFNRRYTPHDIATMYWWLELLNKKPQITDSDIAILKKAFEIAFDCNAVNYAYINGIFQNWSNIGIKTIDDYRLHEMQRKCNYG